MVLTNFEKTVLSLITVVLSLFIYNNSGILAFDTESSATVTIVLQLENTEAVFMEINYPVTSIVFQSGSALQLTVSAYEANHTLAIERVSAENEEVPGTLTINDALNLESTTSYSNIISYHGACSGAG